MFYSQLHLIRHHLIGSQNETLHVVWLLIPSLSMQRAGCEKPATCSVSLFLSVYILTARLSSAGLSEIDYICITIIHSLHKVMLQGCRMVVTYFIQCGYNHVNGSELSKLHSIF